MDRCQHARLRGSRVPEIVPCPGNTCTLRRRVNRQCRSNNEAANNDKEIEMMRAAPRFTSHVARNRKCISRIA